MAFTFIFVVVVLTFLNFVQAGNAAESHTIRFDNQCGYGTPTLLQGGKILSTGKDYMSNGPLSSGIAYLQTGNCLFNGENCTLMEMTLGNPSVPGGGSSADISLIAPHAFSVPTAFSYFGGCDGDGASCDNAKCNTAFFKPDDNQVQVACQKDNVNLLITFCGNGKTDSSSSVTKASDTTKASTATQISVSSTHNAAELAGNAPSITATPTPILLNPPPAASASASTGRKHCASKRKRSYSGLPVERSPDTPSRLGLRLHRMRYSASAIH